MGYCGCDGLGSDGDSGEGCRLSHDGEDSWTAAGDGGRRQGYDTRDFVAECRNLQVTPHVAQNEGQRGGGVIDGRTTRRAGYAVSLQSGEDKKSASSRVSWRPKCFWKRGEL